MKMLAKLEHHELATAGDGAQRHNARRMEDAIYLVSRAAGYVSLLVAVAMLVALMV